jgi:transposase
MTYREHGMWEVLDVLQRVHRGEGRRSVQRSTGRDRKTIGRYVDAARELGWTPGEDEPDEALATAVLELVRPGSKDDSPAETERLLLPHAASLKDWLKTDQPSERGLTLTKAHVLLQRRGVQVSYISLYRFAVKHLGFGRKRITVRMADTAPGEAAEIDFGRLGLVPYPETGKRRVLHALVVTLVFSRHQYVHTTHSQKLPDLIEGLEDAWEFFGGVTARAVIDNLKAAVVKADRYDPVFQRTFDEYARYRGFTIDPAVAEHPTGKPHVERQVPYVRENYFRGEQFLSRDHAQQEAIRWCLTTAGLRTHGTTRQHPLSQFETIEKPALRPLEKPRFDTPQWSEPSVHPDCHIRFRHALYSVPYAHVGHKTVVRGDSKLVRIYVRGQLVKIHPTQPPGGRHTDYDDYPPEKSAYAMRDPSYQIRKAYERGESVGQFAERLLSGTFPWAKLRQAQKLLRLADRFGDARVDAACRRALSFEVINVHRVERIVKLALEKDAEDQATSSHKAPEGQVVQLPLRFLREPGSFCHHTPKRKE